MKTFRYMTMAAMAMMMAACSNEIINQTAPATAGNTSTTLPFRATIGASAATRGLTAPTSDADGITAAWAAGEKIALVHGALDKDGNPIVDVMSVTPVEGSTDGSATITGDVTYTKDEDTYLVYVGSEDNMTTFKEWLKEAIGDDDKYNVTNDIHITMALKATSENLKKSDADPICQDGTLATIAKYYDYRLGQSTLKKVGEYATLTDSPVLNPLQAIWKLSFTDGADALALSELTINTVNPSDTNQKESYLVKPSEAGSSFYVALPASTANYQFEATDGTSSYPAKLYGITLTAGKYYQSTVTLKDMLHTPLTLEVTEDDTEIMVKYNVEDGKTIQYQINGKDKIAITKTTNITGLKVGDIVQFFSTNESVENRNIVPSKETYVYGNVMSLIDDGNDGFANDKTISGEYALQYLFYGANQLVFHDKWALVLPATTLANSSYYFMFGGCSGLTKVPDLPATTLADYCYDSMFSFCTGLATLPEKLLPAETLANYCYRRMFESCTGLTTLPEKLLPATTLADHCYEGMFFNCDRLTTPPELPATTLKDFCYYGMFERCTGLTTLPEKFLSAETLADFCYNGMFKNCSSLTKAPDLLAETLTKGCYGSMFSGCSNLNSVKCLATDISAENCIESWLKGVATDGTFTKAKTMTYWEREIENPDTHVPNGTGIPLNWDVVDFE